jgi:Fe-S-cluster-containing hydrogenase component 2
MVCDEVCPFDAIHFKQEPGIKVAVPHVIEDKCAGCGYCENACPVRNEAAIFVIPMGELRPTKGDYETEAKARGLDLKLRPKTAAGYPDQGQEPTGADDLPPGFDAG